MPGFVVEKLGAGVQASSLKPFYNYTWEIKQIFGTGPSSKSDCIIVAKDMSLPSFTVQKTEVIGSSIKYKFAEIANWDDVKITWYDTVDMTKKIREWRTMVWTPEEGMKPADTYKRESVLAKFTYDESETVKWTLYNSWPSEIKEGDLTYTGSDAKVVSVTVTYDWAIDS